LMDKTHLGFYASVFVASLGLGMYTYFVPIFAQRFGATFLDLGYIGTAAAATYAVAPILIGHLADRVNRLRLYGMAILINFIATIALAFSRSVGYIILVRALGGLGFAFFWPVTEILVLDLAPREQRVKQMGLYSVAWGSAFLIGPSLGGVVIQNLGFFLLFVISSTLITLAAIPAAFVVLPEHGKRMGGAIRLSEQLGAMRRLFPWYVMTACYGIIFNIFASIFPGYANSVGIGAVLVGVLFTAFGMARVVAYAISDRFLHFGEKKALMAVSLLIGVGCVAIALSPGFIVFLVAIACLGGCFAVIFPLTINLISRHFPDQQAGAAVGSYESVYGIGSMIGPIFAGSVAVFLDVRLSFISASLFAILMMIMVASAKTYSKN